MKKIKNMSKAERHAMIRLLYRFIEIEVDQPEEDIDTNCIYEYSEMIDALIPEDERLSEEELERGLAELKKRAQERAVHC